MTGDCIVMRAQKRQQIELKYLSVGCHIGRSSSYGGGEVDAGHFAIQYKWFYVHLWRFDNKSIEIIDIAMFLNVQKGHRVLVQDALFI